VPDEVPLGVCPHRRSGEESLGYEGDKLDNKIRMAK